MGGLASIFSGPPDPPKAPKPTPPPPKVSDADASARGARRDAQQKKGFEATLLSQGLGKGSGNDGAAEEPITPGSSTPSASKNTDGDSLLGGKKKRSTRRSNLLGRSGGDVGSGGMGGGGGGSGAGGGGAL